MIHRTALLTLSAATLLAAGCNGLHRTGSRSLVFDSDPFVEMNHATAAAETPRTAGRVSLGQLSGDPIYGGPAMATAQAPPRPQGSIDFASPDDFAPMNPAAQVTAQATPIDGFGPGPAARAAQAAATLAGHPAATPPPASGIVQTGYNAAAVATNDQFAPMQAETAPVATPGSVPVPPAADFEDFQLSEADLELPQVPTQNPDLLPAAQTAVPAGRAPLAVPLSQAQAATPAENPWDSAPASVSVTTQPVFSPPAAATQQPAPLARRPVIQDSTSTTKWRSARRM